MDPPHLPPAVPNVVDLPSFPFPPPAAVSDKEARLKFVDDLSIAECISLKSKLISKDDKLVLPSTQSLLQNRLHEVSKSAEVHDVKLNLDKTRLIY